MRGIHRPLIVGVATKTSEARSHAAGVAHIAIGRVISREWKRVAERGADPTRGGMTGAAGMGIVLGDMIGPAYIIRRMAGKTIGEISKKIMIEAGPQPTGGGVAISAAV